MTDTSYDMAGLSAKHSDAGAASRLKKRYWAEIRLKAYGIFAILLAAAALVVLIYTIVAKTLTVTNEYYLSLDVLMEADDRKLATLTDGNPATSVDLKKPLRNALREAANTDLKGRKARPLYDLVSRFEGYELGSIIEADPDVLGSKYHYEALLDDSVQLYLKGDYGSLEDAGSLGTLTISPGDSDDQVILEMPSNALGEARLAMREDRSQEGRVLRRSARDQERAFDETEALFEKCACPIKWEIK
ncbi:MAG: DUF3333 domain-containing protein [Pseudomonadota bacterium]